MSDPVIKVRGVKGFPRPENEMKRLPGLSLGRRFRISMRGPW